MNRLLLALCFLQVLDCTAQVFSNTTSAACDGWDSNFTYAGFQRSVAVSGLASPLSAGGTVLRQVNLQLGTASCTGSMSTYFARIISPSGTIIQLFSPFTTSAVTDQWIDIHFRDDPSLERVRDYSTTTQQDYYPWSVGYYRTETANAFATVNGENPNGNWIFQLAENTTSEVSFERVELVFGPPIVVNDVTGTTDNNSCATATCVDGLAVVRGTNNAYSQLDPLYPGNTVDGCAWNGANNNSGWYRFVASGATALITVSGMMNVSGSTSADMQLVVVESTAPACSGAPQVVPPGGCPDPQATGDNNSVYAAPAGGVGTMGNVYVNGITANAEFNLSGLVPGQTYYLIIDGNGGVSSTFYIEMPAGGVACSLPLPVTWSSLDVECRDGNRRVYWTVASQQNNAWFEVERSEAGLAWTTIAVVPGAGTTEESMSYEVTDVTPLSEAGASPVYYRVKQIDGNGNSSHSSVRASSCRMLVYPNPATDHVLVTLPFSGAQVEVVDVTGRIVRIIRSEDSTVHVDIRDLATGYYAVRVTGRNILLSSGVFVKI